MMECAQCYNIGKLQCSRCHHRFYCGVEHQKKDWSRHKQHCFPIASELYNNKENKMLHEALQLNLFEEYKALETRQKARLNDNYNEARYFIYKGLVGMILFNPIDGDYKNNMTQEDYAEWALYRADIKQGYDLMEKEAPRKMWDMSDLFWLFIPRAFHRDIEYICGCD
jgi:hypothetical protein